MKKIMLLFLIMLSLIAGCSSNSKCTKYYIQQPVDCPECDETISDSCVVCRGHSLLFTTTTHFGGNDWMYWPSGENGSHYGWEIINGRSWERNAFVKGYFRKDGIYIPSHWAVYPKTMPISVHTSTPSHDDVE